MFSFFKTDDPNDLHRRSFVTRVASGLLGVNLFGMATGNGWLNSRSTAMGATPVFKPKGKAKRVIYLFMNGAMSQFETFAPKPGTESQGETQTINTKVAGVQFGEHLPMLATQMKNLAVIRSMNTETGVHEAADYTAHTGYRQIASTSHPSLGPWIHRMAGRDNPVLPATVTISCSSAYQGAGYLGSKYTPVPVGDPNKGLQNIKPPKYLSEPQFNHRMEMVNAFDKKFRKKAKNSSVAGYTELYDEAIRLMRSEDLRAFDINEESKQIRAAYGDHRFGQGCLLARRLAQGGVKFIEVALGGWDDHRDLFNALPNRARQLDQGMTALLQDLQSLGMLEETLVVLSTEFGRRPGINANAGRDHHPNAYCSVLAGGGISGGTVYGETDELGRTVEDNPVTVPDFNSTIAYAMGIDHEKEISSPDDRPFTIGNGGQPLTSLFG
jgi:hypothetical protein